MKKIIRILWCFLFLFIPVNANQSVVVSAIVWNVNNAPIIISVTPNSDPRILKTNRTQSYSIYFRDNEKDTITYTITPQNWYTNPISGTITAADYDSNNGTYIHFLYLSPASAFPNESIIVTINDGSTIISKQLNLYIY